MKGFLIGLGVLLLAALLVVLGVLFVQPYHFEVPAEPIEATPVPRVEPVETSGAVQLQTPQPAAPAVSTPVAPNPARQGQAPPPLGGLEDGHVPPGVHPPKKDP